MYWSKKSEAIGKGTVRSFRVLTSHNTYCSGGQITDSEMDVSCGTLWGWGAHIRGCGRNT